MMSLAVERLFLTKKMEPTPDAMDAVDNCAVAFSDTLIDTF